MKNMILAAGAFTLLGAAAQAQSQYVLKHEFRAAVIDNGPAASGGGISFTDSGDIYWVTFEAGASKLIHAPGAVAAADSGTTPPRSVVFTESLAASPSGIESGRGYNDVDVDSNGNIYISGGGGTSVTTVLRKISPAPAHTEIWKGTPDDRYQGLVKVSPDKLISTGFSYLAEINDADGTDVKLTQTTGTQYQRSLAFNPNNNDLYAGRNGMGILGTLNVYSGGSPTNPGDYKLVIENAITSIGMATASGVATNAIDFDPNNSQLISVDQNDTNHPAIGVRIYDVAGSGVATTFSEYQYISGVTPSYPTGYTGVNGVAYRRVGGRDYLAILGSKGEWVVSVYERVSTADVRDWSLYN